MVRKVCESESYGSHGKAKEIQHRSRNILRSRLVRFSRPQLVSRHQNRVNITWIVIYWSGEDNLKTALRPFTYGNIMFMTPWQFPYGCQFSVLSGCLSGTLPNKTLLVTKCAVGTQLEKFHIIQRYMLMVQNGTTARLASCLQSLIQYCTSDCKIFLTLKTSNYAVCVLKPLRLIATTTPTKSL